RAALAVRAGPGGHAGALRRTGTAPAAAGPVAADRVAAAAPARMAAAVAGRDDLRPGRLRRPGLAVRRLGAAGAGLDPVERVRRPPARAPRRLQPAGRAGGGARGLVVAALALRRDRHAAGAAAAPRAAGPLAGHGVALAGHRRRRHDAPAPPAAAPGRP